MDDYKINKPIKVRFQSVGGETGIIDLKLTTTNPNDIDGSPITMVEISGHPGIYEATFTPDLTGRWWIKITSVLHPENGSSSSYWVGSSFPKYRLQLEVNDNAIDFVNDNWHTVFDVTSEGKPSYLWTEFYDGNYEIRITIDGEVCWQLDNNLMGNFDFNDRNQVGYKGFVIYRRSTDIISWHFSPSLTFDNSFKYEVRRRTGNGHGFDRGIFQWEKKYS